MSKRMKIILVELMFLILLLAMVKVDSEMKRYEKTSYEPEYITVTEYVPQIEYIPQIEYVEVPVPGRIYGESLGEFEVTYYTAGVESTGKSPGHPQYGITKSGARVEEDVTVAVDPTVIPLGTYLYVEGIGFRVAQDTGGAIKGNKIDIYVPDVNTAREGGRHKAEVFIMKGDIENE